MTTDLTPGELSVLRELALGKSNRDIANTLLVSDKTVKAHLVVVFQKLQVDNRVAAVVTAIALGYVPCPGS
jgi:DNA-binding NarL/FixJ family response regulator